MKNCLCLLALMLASIPMFAEHVKTEEAQKAALTFLNNNGAKATQLTDLTESAGFPNLYIFTADEGFVVMAADDRVKPILGYSLTGHFSTKDMPLNVYDWLQDYNDEIQYVIENYSTSSPETAQLWKDLKNGKSNAATTTVVVDALVQTQWNQNGSWYWDPVNFQMIFVDLFNNLCPYDNTAGELTVTGCVATAMAQVMKYWNFPSKGIGSHSYIPMNRPEFGEQFADFGSTTYEWSNMPNSLDNNSTEVQKNAIATLMYHCGVSVEMMYDIASNGGSAASSLDIPNALYSYFGYKTSTYLEKNSYSDSQWLSMLKAELNASRPVEYNGRGSAGGHAFVCDGYDSNNNFHFNWGWAGANDGFYSLTNLVPGSGGAGGGNYNFTNNQSAVFGIQPTSNNAIPTNLTYTLSGIQDITLSWNGSSGAVSYNIYCNGNLVGNTTANTYADTAPFGTDVYYVRSVNSAGDLSLPSNLITVTIDYQMPVVDLTATLSGNNVSLSWTTPEWCYPETPSATLTYGTQTNSGYYYDWSNNTRYWGHRHLAENISQYNGLRLYDVDFYTNTLGTYELYIFEGTTTNYGYTIPMNQVYSQSVLATNSGWNTINLSTPYYINGNQDLWIFIHNPEAFDDLQVFICTAEGNNGIYYSSDPTSYTYNNSTGYAFLLKTYLTDGTYTYNLYRNDAIVAQNLSSTTYNTQLSPNNANLFSVKTNYYGGETEPSNKIGYAKGNATLSNLDLRDIDVMNVLSGSRLTISGTLSNNNPASLIIENGAQLVHNSANVKATVMKSVTPYNANQNNNWQLIGSPITENLTPSTDNGLLDSSYDLYYYDEPTFYWMNYKTVPFNLEHKKGYLYANGHTGGTTLQMAGTLQPSNASVTISNLSHSASHLNGFNLVANPFVCSATINKDFYVMNAEGTDIILAANGQEIAPCEGIFVVATDANPSVTFTKSTATKVGNGSLDVTVARNGSDVDRARVRFGEADLMEKFNLTENSSKLYFQMVDKELAVASANESMPLCFKSAQTGTYTLSFNTEDTDLNYLHLIDNLTGADIDLLSTPSYTFDAKTSDYKSRFRLVFVSSDEDADGNMQFAFISNGKLIISEGQNAIVQLIDLSGQILRQEHNTNTIELDGLPSGIYVVRLIGTDNIKTQKIILD